MIILFCNDSIVHSYFSCIFQIFFVPLRKFCAMKTEMKNYLELKIPVQRNAQWYRELCDAMQEERIPVRWQNGFYHITVAFLHNDNHVMELRDAFSQILSGRQAPSITLDKLEAFATQSGKEIVINLAPSHPSDEAHPDRSPQYFSPPAPFCTGRTSWFRP